MMVTLLIIYGVIAVPTYLFLARYRNQNSNKPWDINSVGPWGALLFSIVWPLVGVVELVTFFVQRFAPVIDKAVQSLHRRASK